jgi:hypothetical protein
MGCFEVRFSWGVRVWGVRVWGVRGAQRGALCRIECMRVRCALT